MKIYTKFGDRGQTVLFDGRRVPKDHLRIETYGTVDELNSHLGLAIAGCGGRTRPRMPLDPPHSPPTRTPVVSRFEDGAIRAADVFADRAIWYRLG